MVTCLSAALSMNRFGRRMNRLFLGILTGLASLGRLAAGLTNARAEPWKTSKSEFR